MQGSEQVVAHAGGAWDTLNHYDSGGGCRVTTQHDEWFYVIGQDVFRMARYSLPEWLGKTEQNDPSFIGNIVQRDCRRDRRKDSSSRLAASNG